MAKKFVINDQLDNITLAILGLQGADSTGLYFKNFKSIQMLNRMGLAKKVLDSYSQIHVNREKSITVAYHGTGITGATIDEVTFIDAIETAETSDYEFVYDGNAWVFDGNTVVLSEYGITATGTPVEGDSIVVHEIAEDVVYDVLGIDHDIPADPNFTHTITLCSHDCENYNVLAYKKPQLLFYVNPTDYPSGLPAGTYNITLDHGAYDASTSQDGTYQFTTTQDIPAGGGIRHTQLGVYRSDGAYTQANLLTGTFTTYNSIANGRTVIESGLATAVGSSGTNLGTFTAENISLRSSANCNLTRRNGHGSGAYLTSDERQWMNSDAVAGTKSDGDMKWHEMLTVFDLPASYNAAGMLTKLDPSLVAVMGKVLKRTYVQPADRSDANVKYVDSEELVFPLSMNEVNKGTTNDGVYENAVDADGNVKTVPYDYFARRSTNSEFVKYQNGTARAWWLRSPGPSGASYVRNVTSSGALNSLSAYYADGAVAAFNII